MIPIVSVVMPLYNKSFSVAKAISSVLLQTIKEFELIIIDDGSTDGSSQVVAAMKDPRIRCITQTNGGESSARNRGIVEARCDLIAFIDADDEWLPLFLQTVLALHSRFPQAGAFSTGFFGCRDGKIIRFPHAAVELRYDGEIIEDYFKSCTIGSSMIWSSSVMVRRSVFEEVGMFPPGVKNGADLHMWARIALHYPVAWSPVECAVWHLSAENRCAGMVVMEDVPFAEILEHALCDFNIPDCKKEWIIEYLIKCRLNFAEVAFRYNDVMTAKKLLKLTNITKHQKKHRFKLYCRFHLPAWILSFLYSLRSIQQKVNGNNYAVE